MSDDQTESTLGMEQQGTVEEIGGEVRFCRQSLRNLLAFVRELKRDIAEITGDLYNITSTFHHEEFSNKVTGEKVISGDSKLERAQGVNRYTPDPEDGVNIEIQLLNQNNHEIERIPECCLSCQSNIQRQEETESSFHVDCEKGNEEVNIDIVSSQDEQKNIKGGQISESSFLKMNGGKLIDDGLETDKESIKSVKESKCFETPDDWSTQSDMGSKTDERFKTEEGCTKSGGETGTHGRYEADEGSNSFAELGIDERPENEEGSKSFEESGTAERSETDERSKSRQELGTGERPETDKGSKSSEGTGERPETDAGSKSFEEFGTGKRPETDAGYKPFKEFGTGERPETDVGSKSFEGLGTGERPETDAGYKCFEEFGTGERPETGEGSKSFEGLGTGERPETDAGYKCFEEFGTGERPETGEGSKPFEGLGTGEMPEIDEGSKPFEDLGTGERSEMDAGSRSFKEFGTGETPETGAGSKSFERLGTGERPEIDEGSKPFEEFGTGERPETDEGSKSFEEFETSEISDTDEGSKSFEGLGTGDRPETDEGSKSFEGLGTGERPETDEGSTLFEDLGTSERSHDEEASKSLKELGTHERPETYEVSKSSEELGTDKRPETYEGKKSRSDENTETDEGYTKSGKESESDVGLATEEGPNVNEQQKTDSLRTVAKDRGEKMSLNKKKNRFDTRYETYQRQRLRMSERSIDDKAAGTHENGQTNEEFEALRQEAIDGLAIDRQEADKSPEVHKEHEINQKPLSDRPETDTFLKSDKESSATNEHEAFSEIETDEVSGGNAVKKSFSWTEIDMNKRHMTDKEMKRYNGSEAHSGLLAEKGSIDVDRLESYPKPESYEEHRNDEGPTSYDNVGTYYGRGSNEEPDGNGGYRINIGYAHRCDVNKTPFSERNDYVERQFPNQPDGDKALGYEPAIDDSFIHQHLKMTEHEFQDNQTGLIPKYYTRMYIPENYNYTMDHVLPDQAFGEQMPPSQYINLLPGQLQSEDLLHTSTPYHNNMYGQPHSFDSLPNNNYQALTGLQMNDYFTINQMDNLHQQVHASGIMDQNQHQQEQPQTVMFIPLDKQLDVNNSDPKIRYLRAAIARHPPLNLLNMGHREKAFKRDDASHAGYRLRKVASMESLSSTSDSIQHVESLQNLTDCSRAVEIAPARLTVDTTPAESAAETENDSSKSIEVSRLTAIFKGLKINSSRIKTVLRKDDSGRKDKRCTNPMTRHKHLGPAVPDKSVAFKAVMNCCRPIRDNACCKVLQEMSFNLGDCFLSNGQGQFVAPFHGLYWFRQDAHIKMVRDQELSIGIEVNDMDTGSQSWVCLQAISGRGKQGRSEGTVVLNAGNSVYVRVEHVKGYNLALQMVVFEGQSLYKKA